MRHLIWSVILIPHVVEMNASTDVLDRTLVQYAMGKWFDIRSDMEWTICGR